MSAPPDYASPPDHKVELFDHRSGDSQVDDYPFGINVKDPQGCGGPYLHTHDLAALREALQGGHLFAVTDDDGDVLSVGQIPAVGTVLAASEEGEARAIVLSASDVSAIVARIDALLAKVVTQ